MLFKRFPSLYIYIHLLPLYFYNIFRQFNQVQKLYPFRLSLSFVAMRFLKLFFISSTMAATTAAASVLPHSNGEPFGCSTPAMSDSQRAAAKAMSRQEMQMHEHERVSVEAINVDTYIHVVAANKTVEGGYVNVSFKPAVCQLRRLHDR